MKTGLQLAAVLWLVGCGGPSTARVDLQTTSTTGGTSDLGDTSQGPPAATPDGATEHAEDGAMPGYLIDAYSAKPSSTMAGDTITIAASAQVAVAATDLLVDLEIYDASGTRLAQKYFTSQNFAAGQTLAYSWSYAVPADTVAGTYTLKAGIFDASWKDFYWNGNVGTFAVTAGTTTTTTTGTFGIKVSGSHFVSTKDGSTVELHGVSISGLEQGASALNTSAGDYGNATDPGFAAMASWNINLVRIPLNEETWLGIHDCVGDGGSTSTLQANLKKIVANANANGIYVILDLHWAAPNAFGCPHGQGSMPDADNTANFWSSVAAAFKDNPAVLFEMFNEPFGSNVYGNWVEAIGSSAPSGQSATDLSILLNGGSYDEGYQYQCNEDCGSFGSVSYAPNTAPFKAAGMQSLLDAIRATGATNVVLSNAIGWAGEIQTWLSAQPKDSGGQLAAGWHEDGGGQSTLATAQAVLSAGYPIIITEAYNAGENATGFTDPSGGNVFAWAMTNHVGYSYWAWVPWSGGILQNATSYAPTALGSSLKSSYCGRAKVNAGAQCP